MNIQAQTLPASSTSVSQALECETHIPEILETCSRPGTGSTGSPDAVNNPSPKSRSAPEEFGLTNQKEHGCKGDRAMADGLTATRALRANRL